MAMKYHPKNNTTPEAATKFADVARAYEEIMNAKQ